MTDGQRRTAPGITEIRLSGQAEDVTVLVSVLEQMSADAGVEVLTRSAPYANRRDTAQRVYLMVRVEPGRQGCTGDPCSP